MSAKWIRVGTDQFVAVKHVMAIIAAKETIRGDDRNEDSVLDAMRAVMSTGEIITLGYYPSRLRAELAVVRLVSAIDPGSYPVGVMQWDDEDEG